MAVAVVIVVVLGRTSFTPIALDGLIFSTYVVENNIHTVYTPNYSESLLSNGNRVRKKKKMKIYKNS